MEELTLNEVLIEIASQLELQSQMLLDLTERVIDLEIAANDLMERAARLHDARVG